MTNLDFSVAVNQPLHFLSSNSKKVKATNRRETTGAKAVWRVTIHHVVFAWVLCIMPRGFTGQYGAQGLLDKNQTAMDSAKKVFQVVWMLLFPLFGRDCAREKRWAPSQVPHREWNIWVKSRGPERNLKFERNLKLAKVLCFILLFCSLALTLHKTQ